jgi:hypothetical protein
MSPQPSSVTETSTTPHGAVDKPNVSAQRKPGVRLVEAELGGTFAKILVTSAAAFIGAIGLWFANRVMGRAAFQQAINSGFKELVDGLQEERKELTAKLNELETKYDKVQADSLAERAQLRGEIINLTQVVVSLENLLRDNGVPVPERIRPPAAYATMLPPSIK